MISLPAGVKIIKFYDSEMHKVGKGILYLLNNGILFEKKGEGVKFECNFDHLASFEAVKKDKLLVVIRAPEGRRSVEFKVNPANQVEYDITQANQENASTSADSVPIAKNTEKHDDTFDQDAHSRSEALWFQKNQKDIERFLKPERIAYLNEFIKNAKIGTPGTDPYLLLVDHENLTYKDFADLPGFLKWRYGTMTDKEVEMIVDVFRDFDNFSVRTLEMQIQRATKSKNYIKHDRSLYEHVAINSREIADEISTKNVKA
ncbi:MAG: hypothetical protein WBF38_08915 [Nitrosotalea sp.]